MVLKVLVFKGSKTSTSPGIARAAAAPPASLNRALGRNEKLQANSKLITLDNTIKNSRTSHTFTFPIYVFLSHKGGLSPEKQLIGAKISFVGMQPVAKVNFRSWLFAAFRKLVKVAMQQLTRVRGE